MKNEDKRLLFVIGCRIAVLEKEIQLLENMKHYANLEYNRLLIEIEKHRKEKELYQSIKNGEKISNIKLYKNLNAIILCESIRDNFEKEIKHKYIQIKKLENKQQAIIEKSINNKKEKIL